MAFRNHQHGNVRLPGITFLDFSFFFKVKLRKNHSQHVLHLLSVTSKYANVLDALQALNLTGSFDFHLFYNFTSFAFTEYSFADTFIITQQKLPEQQQSMVTRKWHKARWQSVQFWPSSTHFSSSDTVSGTLYFHVCFQMSE